MKKIALFFAAAAAVAGLSACSQDDSPVLDKPTEFKLNTPQFVDQFYQLTENGTVQLTCSQPDYGVGVATTYNVEISLTEDFAKSAPIATANPLSATLTMSAADINLAVLGMLGITDEETWAPYADNRVMPVYFRATAQAADVEYSKITSNVVKLPNVEIFFAIKLPGYIYLIGSPSGWNSPSPNHADVLKDWRLFENEAAIGSKIYTGVFTLPANPVFRFYTALTEAGDGWEVNSIGCAGGPNDDKEVPCEFKDGIFNGTIAETKDKFDFAGFEGGEVTITVDLNAMTIKIQAGAVEVHPTTYIYMVGNNAGWQTPDDTNLALYDNWRLVCSDGSGVYSETFNDLALPADAGGALYCRFYRTLAGWVDAQWASTTDKDFDVSSGVAVPTKVGQGCFKLADAEGKNVKVVLDTNSDTVTFTFVE